MIRRPNSPTWAQVVHLHFNCWILSIQTANFLTRSNLLLSPSIFFCRSSHKLSWWSSELLSKMEDVGNDSNRNLEDFLWENPHLVIDRLEKLERKRKVVDVDEKEDVVEVEVPAKNKQALRKPKLEAV